MLSFVNLLMWFVFFDGAYSKVGGDVVCDVQPSNYTREECITAWNLMTKPFRPENRDGPTTPVVLKKDTASATFQNCEITFLPLGNPPIYPFTLNAATVGQTLDAILSNCVSRSGDRLSGNATLSGSSQEKQSIKVIIQGPKSNNRPDDKNPEKKPDGKQPEKKPDGKQPEKKSETKDEPKKIEPKKEPKKEEPKKIEPKKEPKKEEPKKNEVKPVLNATCDVAEASYDRLDCLTAFHLMTSPFRMIGKDTFTKTVVLSKEKATVTYQTCQLILLPEKAGYPFKVQGPTAVEALNGIFAKCIAKSGHRQAGKSVIPKWNEEPQTVELSVGNKK